MNDENIKRPLLGHAAEGGEDDLLRLLAKHFEDRHARDLLLVEDALEHRRLENAEPDPHPDADHDDADPERHTPAPGEKLVPGDRAEHEDGNVGEEEASRGAPLRP
jgi:hypothetical protein